MAGFMLAHAGDASGLAMLAFFPVGVLLVVGIIIALRPAMTSTGLSSEEEEADDSAPDAQRESDTGHR